MADRLYTSSQADEYISGLRMETKLEKATIAKMAFAISLSTEGTNVSQSNNFSGGEMKRPTFFGSDELFIKTLIKHVYSTAELDEDLLYSNKSIIKNHIDSGASILWDIFQKDGQDINRWYKDLTSKIELEGLKRRVTKDLDILLGKNVITNEEIFQELNNTNVHANSHLAIMGKPGVGKTQFLLKILADIRIQSKNKTNFIIFDYKGDIVTNEKFVDVTSAKTYRLLKNNQNLPINPFVLQNYDESSIHLSAREKAESFASINSKLGIVQKGALIDSVVSAYAKRANTEKPFPDFNDVLEVALFKYEAENKNDDTLIEVLKDLAKFNLFWSHGNPHQPMDKVSNKTMIIDVHSMPVLKELVAYLVIERLYKEMAALPDSQITNDRRDIRTILVIDEAHNYLSQKNMFLERIIREGRSKGIFVFFASQSPADYQQKFFNFRELLEFVYIFQSEGIAPASIQEILGCTNKTAKELQVEISKLERFQVIARSSKKTEEYSKINVIPFYSAYK